jgi:hypothetical protein
MTLNLITYLLLIVPIVTVGQQKVTGTFCDYGSGYGGECLTLTDSGTFVLDGSSCFGNYFGKGNFQFLNDTLKLEFLDEDNQANEIKILKVEESKNDTSVFQVGTKDKNQGIVPFTEVSFYQKNPTDDDVPIFKASTDQTGTLETTIPKSDKVEFIKIWYIGKKPVIEKIKIGYDYIIHAEINMSDTSFITNGLREYKFEQINKNSIKLGRLDWDELKMIEMEKIKKH